MLPRAQVVVHLEAGLRIVEPRIGLVRWAGVVGGQARFRLVVLVIQLQNLRSDLADAVGGNVIVDENATEPGRRVRRADGCNARTRRIDDGALVNGVAAVVDSRGTAVRVHGNAGREHWAQVGVRCYGAIRIQTHHRVRGYGAAVGAGAPHRLHVALEGEKVKQLVLLDRSSFTATPVGERVADLQVRLGVRRISDSRELVAGAQRIQISRVHEAEKGAVNLVGSRLHFVAEDAAAAAARVGADTGGVGFKLLNSFHGRLRLADVAAQLRNRRSAVDEHLFR